MLNDCKCDNGVARMSQSYDPSAAIYHFSKKARIGGDFRNQIC